MLKLLSPGTEWLVVESAKSTSAANTPGAAENKVKVAAAAVAFVLHRIDLQKQGKPK